MNGIFDCLIVFKEDLMDEMFFKELLIEKNML